MKMSIAWHRACLANHVYSVAEERRQVDAALKRLELSEARLRHEQLQFQEAEKRGLDGYDRDRFLVKREEKRTA